LKDQGRILMVEPKLFHVSRKDFEVTMNIAKEAGFRITPGPRLLLSWSAILENA
jgi:hypothetical protein